MSSVDPTYHAAMAMTGKRGGSARSKAHRKPARAMALPSTNTFIRVYHSEALHQRTLVVLDALEQADDPTMHRAALSNLIIELTGSALDYCFMQPLRLTRPGFIVEQIASLGMTGVQQIIGPAVHQVIGHMDGRQLLSVCNSIRRFML